MMRERAKSASATRRAALVLLLLVGLAALGDSLRAEAEPQPGAQAGSPQGGSPPAALQPAARAGPAAAKAGPGSQTVTRVWMSPKVAKVRVGRRLTVRVMISNASDLGHTPFHVLYDPKVLRFEGGVEGPFMRSGGRETAFFAAPTSSGNELVVGLSRLRRGNGAAGRGELCTLNFTAVGRGDARLAFASAKVRDAENKITPSVFEPARVRVR